MNASDADAARTRLESGGYTLVLCKDGILRTASDSGIIPMLKLIDEGVDLAGYVAADKIIGKAAAALFVYAGINEVYGEVMSRSALEYLKKHGIKASYGVMTEQIINRSKTAICPMEQTAAEIDEPAEIYRALKQKCAQMRIYS